MASPANPVPIPVSTPANITSLLDTLGASSTKIPSVTIYIDTPEPVPAQEVTWLTLMITPVSTVYAINLAELGPSAFTTTCSSSPGSTLHTLKSLLESPQVPKTVFDARRGANVLFTRFGLKLDGVTDVQFLELAARKGRPNVLSGFGECVERDCGLSTEEMVGWRGLEAKADEILRRERVVGLEVMLQPTVAKYCVQRVVYLERLGAMYDGNLHAFWKDMVKRETKSRVERSCVEGCHAQVTSGSRGPWDPGYVEDRLDEWNENVLEEWRMSVLEETEEDRRNEAILQQWQEDMLEETEEDRRNDAILDQWREDMLDDSVEDAVDDDHEEWGGFGSWDA